MGYLWLLSFFAAFGVLCVLWAVFGWLLPVCRDGWILYPAPPGEQPFVQVYLWLKGMGILKCPLVLLDQGLDETQKRLLRHRGIEIYTAVELPLRLGMGAKEI